MWEQASGMSAAGPGLAALDEPLVRAVAETGAYAGGLYLLDARAQVLRLAVVTGFPPDMAGAWTRVPVASPVPSAAAVREQRLIWLGSGSETARRFPRSALALPYDFAQVAAPVMSGTSCWGVVVMLWSGAHPSRLAAREREVIDEFCRRAGALLRQAAYGGRPLLAGPETRVLDRSPVRRWDPSEARAALDFIDALPEGCCALDLDGRVVFVTELAAQLLGRSVSELLGSRPWEALPWLDDPDLEDRYRAAVVSRRSMSFTARRPPDQWLSFQLYPGVAGLSVRISPLEGGPPHPDPGGTSPSRRSLPLASSRAGVLYQLMGLAATLTEAVSVRDVVDLVADHIMPVFDAQALALYLAEGERLVAVGGRGSTADRGVGFDAGSETVPLPVQEAVTARAARFIGSPDELERVCPGAPRPAGTAAWAVLPLIASDRTVGCCMLAFGAPRAFAPEDRVTLTALAGLVAQALDRARLFDVTDRLARGLQASLLPHTLPDLPGLDVAARYLPATRGVDIGGDFYDLIRLGSAGAAAVIGDVQGHNVTAAALMGQVRTAVHAHASAGAHPAELLARTNRLLTELDPGLFTSCLYVHIDVRAQRALLASAGHPPPLLRRPDGRVEVVDVPPGLLLGIEAAAEYVSVEVTLPPGCVLALYTDGLVEAPGVDLDQSICELADELARAPARPLEELADHLVRGVKRTGYDRDDIALLLLGPTAGDGTAGP
ncbi:SpoIIE family protein phosphatase [Streptomyces sp. NPDC006879]|uniref:SpoIIE family protein phosphatase n=1 Tax=Streptomyces sp. NPDC006879 TaxID=3364767 RepID=UPI003683E4B9